MVVRMVVLLVVVLIVALLMLVMSQLVSTLYCHSSGDALNCFVAHQSRFSTLLTAAHTIFLSVSLLRIILVSL